MNEMGYYNILLSYLNHGLSIIPIIRGSKKPAIAWKVYQERLPTKEELRSWFKSKQSFDVAVIAGKVSGNLEIIDIDNHLGDADNIFWEWKEILNNTRQDIWKKLLIQKTQSKGYHVIYRADDNIPNNTKIASRTVDGQIDTFIETRGEGGYALIYPSLNYSILQGSFQNLPNLTRDERNLLIAICKSFNQQAKESISNSHKTETQKDRPGDLFNQKGDIKSYLERHGWKLIHSSGAKEFWQRPGKESRDWSATFNFIPNKFYVFSTNASPFEPERAYDKFSVYTLLEHNGDFTLAAKRLAEMGFTSNGRSQARMPSADNQKNEADLPPLTQVGNAMRFANTYKGKLKYNHTNKEWLLWDGTRWLPDSNDHVRLLAKTISDQILQDEPLYVAKGYDPKSVRAWYKSSQSLRNIDDSLKLAACEPVFATTSNDWDKNPFLINFLNGTLNLQTTDFYKNNPQDMITKIIPINYNPNVKSELWASSLRMYFRENQELISFVQKVCGLSLCGAHLEEIIVFLYGTGANGKSIFVNTLRFVYGEYASILPIEALIAQHFDDAKKAEIASLVGSRFVVTTEIPIGKYLNEATVKMLTGGDAIKVRHLYKNFFTFEPTFTLWIFGNHKPEIRGADNGIWRRMVLIPFEYTIPEEERLPQKVIMDRLQSEAEGILAWIVEGWKRYKEEGLARPSIVVAATTDYKDDQDPLFGFFADKIVTTADGKTKGADIYEAYTKWCEEQKERPIGKKIFFRILEEKGFPVTKDRKGQKLFIGLSLNDTTTIQIPISNNTKTPKEDEYDEPF